MTIMLAAQALDEVADLNDLLWSRPTVGSSRIRTGRVAQQGLSDAHALAVALRQVAIRRPYTSSILTSEQISAMCSPWGSFNLFLYVHKSSQVFLDGRVRIQGDLRQVADALFRLQRVFRVSNPSTVMLPSVGERYP